VGIVVRRIEAHEGPALKAVRLAALADAPYAFSSTFEGESGRADGEWAQRAALGADGPDRATFFAVDGGAIVGLAGGYREAPDDDLVDLVSMWTSPAARRRGAGAALVVGVIDWARATGAEAVSLWVTRGNDAAESLYRSMGFVLNGEYQPLPSDPCKDEVRMILQLR
jgi:GNAT superfamily N-acetyltransferase